MNKELETRVQVLTEKYKNIKSDIDQLQRKYNNLEKEFNEYKEKNKNNDKEKELRILNQKISKEELVKQNESLLKNNKEKDI